MPKKTNYGKCGLLCCRFFMQHKALSSAKTERLLHKAITPPEPVSLQGFVVETQTSWELNLFFFWKVDSMVHFESQTSPNESQLHLTDLHSKTFCSFFFFFFDFQCWKFSLGNSAGSFLIFTAPSKKICAGWSVQKPIWCLLSGKTRA